MSKFTSTRSRKFYAQTFGVSVSDWPGEIDFYQKLAQKASAKGAVLKLA
jgi:predicted enzyme related to lactoylglutathione lyase